MKIYCYHCGRILGLLRIRCPYCQQSAMSWLHIILITAFAMTAIFYLLKTF